MVVNGERIERLGADLPVDRASGEFIGLVFLSSFGVFGAPASYRLSLRRRHLSEYIEHLRAAGLSVRRRRW